MTNDGFTARHRAPGKLDFGKDSHDSEWSSELQNNAQDDQQDASPSFLSVALQKTVMRRALGYAVVVGAILVSINHGDALLQGEISGKRLLQIALTICVPYCVSTASSVGAIRSQKA